MYKYLFLLIFIASMIVGTASPPAQAQATGASWPVRPVRLIVTFPPGSSTDTTARIIAPRLAGLWGQPMVIENRTGAGGSLGASVAAQATPDGYTIVYVSASFAINAVLRRNAGYDPLRDFVPVTLVGIPTSVITAAPSLGVKSIKELIALSHERGGKLLYGSPGAGSGGHLAIESFRSTAGMKGVHVAYKGQPEIMVELLAGRVHYSIISMGPGVGLFRDGRLLPLAVLAPKRSPVLPEVPTLNEILPAFRRDASHMMLVPAKSPRAVVAKIARDTARVLDMPEVRKQLEVIDFVPAPTSPEETEKILRAQLVMFNEVARAAGLMGP
jgi:tripartite-type tricarboxylate transporter receptor subunit TctC